MVNIYCILSIASSNYDLSAEKMPDDLTVLKIVSIGDTLTLGRHKGQIATSNEIHLAGDPSKIIRYAEHLHSVLSSNEIEYYDLHLNVGYTGQCNFEITTSQIQSLSRLNIPLSVTCYEVE